MEILHMFIKVGAKNKDVDKKSFLKGRKKMFKRVDLKKSYKITIYLPNTASIQPRTSPPKFGL